jgi:hypothetical protein
MAVCSQASPVSFTACYVLCAGELCGPGPPGAFCKHQRRQHLASRCREGHSPGQGSQGQQEGWGTNSILTTEGFNCGSTEFQCEAFNV